MTNRTGRRPEPFASRVRVLVAEGRDRQSLTEWLDRHGDYEVLVSEPSQSVPFDYDLLLTDETALEQCRESLRANRQRAEPATLPHLLVQSRDSPPDDTGDSTADDGDDFILSEDPDNTFSDPRDRALVDSVLQTPFRTTELQRRIDTALERRELSLRLTHLQEQYEQLVDLTPETILLIRHGSVVYANAAAARLFGVADPADLIGTNVEELVLDREIPALGAVFDMIDADGCLDEFEEVTLRTVDGTPVVTEIVGVTVVYEERPTTQLVIRDVTEERARERRLDLFGRAVEAADQGITIADATAEDEPLIYANAAFERITGYPREEIIGQNCRFLQGEGTDTKTVAEIGAAIRNHEPITTEILNYRKDGTPFWNLLNIVPVRDDRDTVTHFVGLQQDVTERKTQEERLSVLDRVLRHNIRNRMNVISGTAELLSGSLGADADVAIEDSVDDETVSDGLARIVDAAEELHRISEQVREFQTVVGDPGRQLEPQSLTRILESLRSITEDRDDGTVFDLVAEEDLLVEAHPKLGDALAIGVELVADRPDPMDILVEASADGSVVHLDVTDRGGTIPREDLEAIAAERETPIRHSRGLELWIVRWTVLSSKGELGVTFDDEPTMRITLPRANPSAESSDSTVGQPEAANDE
jgi:PAS domain S-box-containing protein